MIQRQPQIRCEKGRISRRLMLNVSCLSPATMEETFAQCRKSSLRIFGRLDHTWRLCVGILQRSATDGMRKKELDIFEI